jgi:alkylation response protein AidB-like acyl-CoA dehydrogenase
MRIHGGYGYSAEYEVERLYRDAPLMAIGEGTNDILRTLIARDLVREAQVASA